MLYNTIIVSIIFKNKVGFKINWELEAKAIVKKIVQTPGIISLISYDSETEKVKKLNAKNYYNAIKILETENGIILNLHLQTSIGIPLESIAKEVKKIIDFHFKDKNIKIKSVNCYFGGIE